MLKRLKDALHDAEYTELTQSKHGVMIFVNRRYWGVAIQEWGLRLMFGRYHLCFHRREKAARAETRGKR